MFWDRQSHAERLAAIHEIQESLRRHHRNAQARGASEESFLVPNGAAQILSPAMQFLAARQPGSLEASHSCTWRSAPDDTPAGTPTPRGPDERNRWIACSCVGCLFRFCGTRAYWTADEVTGVQDARKAVHCSPNWVFAGVTLLYALMSVAAWRVWLAADSPLRTWVWRFPGAVSLEPCLVVDIFQSAHLGAALAEVALLWVPSASPR